MLEVTRNPTFSITKDTSRREANVFSFSMNGVVSRLVDISWRTEWNSVPHCSICSAIDM